MSFLYMSCSYRLFRCHTTGRRLAEEKWRDNYNRMLF